MLLVFTPIDKMIDGVKYTDVARDELGKEMTLIVDNLFEPSVNEMVNGHIRVQVGKTIYLTRDLKVTANRCEHVSRDVTYEGALGAPGIGHSWKCVCGEKLWGFRDETLVPFKDLDESDYIMSESDVI